MLIARSTEVLYLDNKRRKHNYIKIFKFSNVAVELFEELLNIIDVDRIRIQNRNEKNQRQKHKQSADIL